LAKEACFLRIEPAGQKVDGDFPGMGSECDGIAHGGESVEIGDEVQRLPLFLQLDGWFHHAEVIAKMRKARGLDAGKNTHGAV